MSAKVRIVSDGTSHGTRVLIRGRDVTDLVEHVTWYCAGGEPQAKAIVTFNEVTIDAEGLTSTEAKPLVCIPKFGEDANDCSKHSHIPGEKP